jgi:hypothetical protein
LNNHVVTKWYSAHFTAAFSNEAHQIPRPLLRDSGFYFGIIGLVYGFATSSLNFLYPAPGHSATKHRLAIISVSQQTVI